MEKSERIQIVKELVKKVKDYPKGHEKYCPTDMLLLEVHINKL